MLQCSAGKEFQRLKDSDIQQRQKLEAANHRIAELENQLSKKEQLILDQKKLMEDTKNQSRSESLLLSLCHTHTHQACEALLADGVYTGLSLPKNILFVKNRIRQ